MLPPPIESWIQVIPVKKKKSKSTIERKHRPSFYTDPAFVRFLCQAFVPPQVDDPLNLAGAYS